MSNGKADIESQLGMDSLEATRLDLDGLGTIGGDPLMESMLQLLLGRF